eukprot:TRINITY_DN21786_c0_g1_i1.p1 TRINITY_DN21786_c0_g1~~TRINITY_DN21786_c0_g1_i1.p1  ORF type:complete len:185 (-),score=68.67 TRINITY_DN21786_c0_g1_i1:81-605(-)
MALLKQVTPPILFLMCSILASPKVHILECSGSARSFCEDKVCQVICSDGQKVELECEHGSINIKSTQASTEVSCGAPINPEDFPSFPDCFPFCAQNTKAEQPFNNPFEPCFPFCDVPTTKEKEKANGDQVYEENHWQKESQHENANIFSPSSPASFCLNPHLNGNGYNYNPFGR